MTSPLEFQFPQDAGQIALSALTRAPFAMVITDPHQDDNPVVYVNEAFCRVTGYSREAAVGRNCRFLQGADTDRETVEEMRNAIAEERQITVDIRNYRADGKPFWNRLMIAPLAAPDGTARYFLGVQMALPDSTTKPAELKSRDLDLALSEVQHRVKNHLAMIVGMIRMQARSTSAREEFETLSHRIETLQLLYEELSDAVRGTDTENAPVSLGSYLSRVAHAIAHIDGRPGVRVNVEADAVMRPFEDATRMGLITSELMTNAMQHGFPERGIGMVEMRLKSLSNGITRLQVVDDGVGMPAESSWPHDGSLGGRIVEQLVEALNASITVSTSNAGTTVTVDMPPSDRD